MKYISRLTDAEYDAQSEIGQLLHHVAWGNLDGVTAILAKSPRLLLEAGDVEDPAGNIIRRVTPYECALGAGDDEMAATIGQYFTNVALEDGEKERSRQYARYQPHINNMLTQPAYDFSALLEMIKESSAKDVQAALDLEFNPDLPLHAALDNFRKYFAPREIKGGMHFNYADLLQALKVYADEFDALYTAGGDNYSKCDLFWRQVIGYIQRGLPAIDRMVFAQSLYEVVEQKEKIERSFKFKYDNANFPVTAGDLSCSGLGFEFGAEGGARARDGRLWAVWTVAIWKSYVEQKLQTCKTYATNPATKCEPVCDLLRRC